MNHSVLRSLVAGLLIVAIIGYAAPIALVVSAEECSNCDFSDEPDVIIGEPGGADGGGADGGGADGGGADGG